MRGEDGKCSGTAQVPARSAKMAEAAQREGESFLLGCLFLGVGGSHLGSAHFPAPLKPRELHCSPDGTNEAETPKCKPCRGPSFGTIYVLNLDPPVLLALLSSGAGCGLCGT